LIFGDEQGNDLDGPTGTTYSTGMPPLEDSRWRSLEPNWSTSLLPAGILELYLTKTRGNSTGTGSVGTPERVNPVPIGSSNPANVMSSRATIGRGSVRASCASKPRNTAPKARRQSRRGSLGIIWSETRHIIFSYSMV
jgi:hypothetical protein